MPRLRFLAALPAFAACVLAVCAGAAAAASAGGRLARFCGSIAGGGAQLEIHASGAVRCARARDVIADSLTLPPSGNSPGAPRGWVCYRITGAPPTGIACDRRGRPLARVAAVGAPEGSARRRVSCSRDAAPLRDAFEIVDVRARGMSCPVAVNAVAYWASEWGRTTAVGRGPTGYDCRIEEDRERSSVAHYDCRRDDRRILFELGDR